MDDRTNDLILLYCTVFLFCFIVFSFALLIWIEKLKREGRGMCEPVSLLIPYSIIKSSKNEML